MHPRVIPCLLLRGEGLVKTVQFKEPKYVGDPFNTLRIFNEKEVDEIIFLDITATPEGFAPRLDLIKELASECFMPLGYGGGIQNLPQIDAILRAGVEKVVVNSLAFTNPTIIQEASKKFGAQAIVGSIDVKRGFFGGQTVYSHGGRQAQKISPVEHAKRLEALGVGEILINAIDRDGTGKGYDLELVQQVAEAVGVPVVACGGAGQLSDFRAAAQAGASAVSAGSFFVFQGKHRAVLITYPSQEDFAGLFGE